MTTKELALAVCAAAMVLASSTQGIAADASTVGSGRAPSFSDSAVALTMTMNRIAKSPLG